MTKRTMGLSRRKNDAYDTPEHAVWALLPHLQSNTKFAEPCAGNGQLIQHLTKFGHECVFNGDIQPRATGMYVTDACVNEISFGQQCFITNPPWTRSLLHPIIVNLSDQAPVWLLFDADWMHTIQAMPYLERCDLIVSVGRVKWFPESKHVGMDNCCWYRFDPRSRNAGRAPFVPRNSELEKALSLHKDMTLWQKIKTKWLTALSGKRTSKRQFSNT